MLIDWLSLRFELKTASDIAVRDKLAESRDMCARVDENGVCVTRWWPEESKRSDSHHVTVHLSEGAIVLRGSPARIGQSHNIFGSADPIFSALKMLNHVAVSRGVQMPGLPDWTLTRIDLTQNYDCGAFKAEALEVLSKVSGGHLKVNNDCPSPRWNVGSAYWSAKAYDKLAHVLKMIKRGKYQASDDELELLKGVLRFEVQIGRKYLYEQGIRLTDLTQEKVIDMYNNAASKIIPADSTLSTSGEVMRRLVDAYGSKRGNTLYQSWLIIKESGLSVFLSGKATSTGFRHLSELKRIGLTMADFQSQTVVAFRPRSIVARPVDSWADLRRAA